jgi:hypothetical protein
MTRLGGEGPGRTGFARLHPRPLLLLVIAAVLTAAGCATTTAAPAPRAADLAAIKPGMTREALVSRLGPPSWEFPVWQLNVMILSYRSYRSDCTVFQVSVRPDGTIQDVGPAWDPACDRPD